MRIFKQTFKDSKGILKDLQKDSEKAPEHLSAPLRVVFSLVHLMRAQGVLLSWVLASWTNWWPALHVENTHDWLHL